MQQYKYYYTIFSTGDQTIPCIEFQYILFDKPTLFSSSIQLLIMQNENGYQGGGKARLIEKYPFWL